MTKHVSLAFLMAALTQFLLTACLSRSFSQPESGPAGAPRVHPIYQVGDRTGRHYGTESSDEVFLNEIQPILNKYCVSCHACTDSPCQLNLTSWDALERGASLLNAYFPPTEVLLGTGVSTRVEEGRPLSYYRPSDAEKVARAGRAYRDFFSVLETVPGLKGPVGSVDSDRSLMQYFIEFGYQQNHLATAGSADPASSLHESASAFDQARVEGILQAIDKGRFQCVPPQASAVADYYAQHEFGKKVAPHRGMPFVTAPMEAADYARLLGWVQSAGLRAKETQPVAAAAADVPLDLTERSRGPATPGPVAMAQLHGISSAAAPVVAAWEAFLNDDESPVLSVDGARQLSVTPGKRRHVAKYVYEHLWYAHIHFSEAPGEFYMLVRASNRTGPVRRLHAEVPSDWPEGLEKGARIYYRFVKHHNAIMRKTHVVVEATPATLGRLATVFFDREFIQSDWDAPDVPEYSYNPFEDFRFIPARSRSTFMNDHARAIFDSVIRGPVCVGRMATYVVDDHFWVWFQKPESDPTVLEYERLAREKKLQRRGQFEEHYHNHTPGSVQDVLDLGKSRRYRLARRKWYEEHLIKEAGTYLNLDHFENRPAEGGEPNADLWLTVYRHETSTSVHAGTRGGAPRSVWLLDYVNFERMYYGISVHYRYFGNAGHKLTSWLYFNQHRTEAEDQFLLLLPEDQRETIRKQWNLDRDAGYTDEKPDFNAAGLLKAATQLKGLDDLFSLLARHAGSAVHYERIKDYTRGLKSSPSNPVGADAAETYEKIVSAIFNRYEQAGVVSPDFYGNFPAEHPVPPSEPQVDQRLIPIFRRVAHAKSRGMARFLPNIVYIRIAEEPISAFALDPEGRAVGASDRLITFINDRGYAFNNVPMTESVSRNPQADSLSIYRGLTGDYPNLFLDVRPGEVGGLIDGLEALKAMDDESGRVALAELVKRFGVDRTTADFWKFIDWAHAWDYRDEPLRAGIVDISNYGIQGIPF